uniref:hypothetical protein n=1 Tax=Agrobacterium tumefaciens TaxID=358 RepID=UPI00155D9D94|nr:hypothetical protein [Agrobacterium tumefaciens]
MMKSPSELARNDRALSHVSNTFAPISMAASLGAAEHSAFILAIGPVLNRLSKVTYGLKLRFSTTSQNQHIGLLPVFGTPG